MVHNFIVWALHMAMYISFTTLSQYADNLILYISDPILSLHLINRATLGQSSSEIVHCVRQEFNDIKLYGSLCRQKQIHKIYIACRPCTGLVGVETLWMDGWNLLS